MSNGISPVLFICKAHKYYPSGYVAKNDAEQQMIDESNFYRCKSSKGNILSYLTRKDSLESDIKHLDEETLRFMEMMSEDGNLDDSSYLNYMGMRGGSTGLFDKDGFVDELRYKEYSQKLKNTESTIWDAVISFVPSYSSQYCDNSLQAQKLLKDTINDFFKKAGLNPDNIEWTGAYHTNTDNRHIHLCFWEKEKTKFKRVKEDIFDEETGEVIGQTKNANKIIECYSDWKLPKDSINDYRVDILKYHKFQEGISTEFLKLRDPIIRDIKLNGEEHPELLIEIQKELGEINTSQYARLNKKQMKTLNKYVETIIKLNPKLLEAYQEYMEGILKYQTELICNYNETKVDIPKELKNFYGDRKNEFYNRAGNVVLKELKQLDLDLNYFKNENERLNKNVDNATSDEIDNFKGKKNFEEYYSDEKPEQINIIDEKVRAKMVAELTHRKIDLKVAKPHSKYKDNFAYMEAKGWTPRTKEARQEDKNKYAQALIDEEDYQQRLAIHREYIQKKKNKTLTPQDKDPINENEISPLKQYYKDTMKRYNPKNDSFSLEDERSIFNQFGIDFVSVDINERELYSINDCTDKVHTEKYHIKKIKFECNCKHYIFRNAKNEFVDYTISYDNDKYGNPPVQFGFAHTLKKLGLTNKEILKLGTMLSADGEAFNLLTKTGSFDANFSDLSDKYKEFDGEKSYSNLGYNKEIARMQNTQFKQSQNRISNAFASILAGLFADMERPRNLKLNWLDKPKDALGNEMTEEEINKLKEKGKIGFEW